MGVLLTLPPQKGARAYNAALRRVAEQFQMRIADVHGRWRHDFGRKAVSPEQAAQLTDQLEQLMEQKLEQKRHALDLYVRKLEGLSPLERLKQGFSYTADSAGRAVTDIGQVEPGDPVKIYVEDEYVRATPGGTGYIKCGGNYAASLIGQMKAHDLGYSQVLWLDGVERKYVEEVGSMNCFFKIDGVIRTAPCVGTVLPGITRMSCIELLEKWGYKVDCESRLPIADVIRAGKEGKLEEVFGTGTAAVISPVGELRYEDEVLTINGFQTGPVTQRLYDTLTGIQWGTLPDDMGWTQEVE